MSTDSVLVVGGSVAGIRLAQALRRHGHRGRVTVLSEEHCAPYDKPPLSKGVLDGSIDHARMRLLQPGEAQRLELDLRLGWTATSLDTSGRSVTAGQGEVAYDRLVIATGARPVVPAWGTEPGLHVLRTLNDARRLRAELELARDAVVVGAGFVGCEVASAAVALGCSVELIDLETVPMARILGEAAGALVSNIARAHGVMTRFGVAVDEVKRDGRRWVVSLADGAVVAGDVVVVGVGAQPNVDWLHDSGLPIEGGVVCDSAGSVVGFPEVYAVGDVASWAGSLSGPRRRREHWTSAVEQAEVVAKRICDPTAPSRPSSCDFVWSEQFGSKIQVVGQPHAARAHAVLGDPDDGAFGVIVADAADRCVGAVVVEHPRALLAIRRLLSAGQPPVDEVVKAVASLFETTGRPA